MYEAIKNLTLSSPIRPQVAPPATDEGFRSLWSFGIEMYLGGQDGTCSDWSNAAQVFTLLLEQRPDDGPARTIMEVMKRRQDPNGQAPADWAGHRSLDEK